jgi:hypothetical protein
MKKTVLAVWLMLLAAGLFGQETLNDLTALGWKGNIRSVKTLTYTVILYLDTYTKGECTGGRVYEYNNEGILVSLTELNSDGLPLYKTTYTYQGDTVTATTYEKDSTVLFSETGPRLGQDPDLQITRDSYSNIISVVLAPSSEPNPVWEEKKDIIALDSHNNITEALETTLFPDGKSQLSYIVNTITYY